MIKQLFPDLSDHIKVIKAKWGVFLNISHSGETDWFQTDLGPIHKLDRFVCSHRKQPFFMDACCGETLSQLPAETQWLGIRHTDGSYSVLYPLADGIFRSSLAGTTQNSITITCETGSDATLGATALACYVAHGENLYNLCENSAKDIADQLNTLRLRKEKNIPHMMRYFGWCTWNAFYADVSADKLMAGMEFFKQNGFVPKFVLLDDGWQSVNASRPDRGKHQLFSFAPNEKFGGDMTSMIAKLKKEYGVALFYVWHAVMGYWGGIDPASPYMQSYQVREKCQRHSKGMFQVNEKYANNLHFPYGMADPKHCYRFYQDYHDSLRKQGVDGVKVDVQAALEGVAYGEGGRVALIRNNHYALEASAQLNFQGELINCMSGSNDIIYSLLNSNMMRSSDDFFPNVPESHGKHVYTNAINSIYMGEFTYCDWDMFQTTHPYGAFHAAARAISGGPVYVSDKGDEHDFNLIAKLVLHDGTLPLCTGIARPTLDSLFVDHANTNVLLKLYNTNKTGFVAGLFHIGENQTKTAVFRPSDLPDCAAGPYAVYLHQQDKLLILDAKEEIEIQLKQREFELCTVTPVMKGIAPIGLKNLFNSGGTILQWDDDNIILADGGDFVCYCLQSPVQVTVNGKAQDFCYQQNWLSLQTNTIGKTNLKLFF